MYSLNEGSHETPVVFRWQKRYKEHVVICSCRSMML